MAIQLKISTGITEDDIMEDHYNHYNFEIIYCNKDLQPNDPNFEEVAGKGSAGLYLVERAQKYKEPDVLMQSFMESNQFQVYKEFFDPNTTNLNEKYENLVFECQMNSNILVINKIEVLPEFRGKGIFKRVINLLRHFFYGCYGIEATTAIPVQLSDTFNYELEQTPWRQEMQYGKFSQDPKVARKAVKILMEKSQYCRARNTDIYYHIPGNDGIFRDADYCSHNVSAERSKQQRDKPFK